MNTTALVPLEVALYEPPAITWDREPAELEEWLWWAVIIGWTFSIALAYAAYCTYRGGDPTISLTWKGFKVSCHR